MFLYICLIHWQLNNFSVPWRHIFQYFIFSHSVWSPCAEGRGYGRNVCSLPSLARACVPVLTFMLNIWLQTRHSESKWHNLIYKISKNRNKSLYYLASSQTLTFCFRTSENEHVARISEIFYYRKWYTVENYVVHLSSDVSGTKSEILLKNKLLKHMKISLKTCKQSHIYCIKTDYFKTLYTGKWFHLCFYLEFLALFISCHYIFSSILNDSLIHLCASVKNSNFYQQRLRIKKIFFFSLFFTWSSGWASSSKFSTTVQCKQGVPSWIHKSFLSVA
jgi:hypothetical protein